MKYLRRFNESDSDKKISLYDRMSELLQRAGNCCGKEFNSPEEAIDGLENFIHDRTQTSVLQGDASDILDDIIHTQEEIDEVEAEEYFNESVNDECSDLSIIRDIDSDIAEMDNKDVSLYLNSIIKECQKRLDNLYL